jgi:hypothetical protein
MQRPARGNREQAAASENYQVGHILRIKNDALDVPLAALIVRVSLLIRAPLNLDIAFRTQKYLSFVRGTEIRVWASPDEMHRPAAKLARRSVVRTKGARLLFGRHKFHAIHQKQGPSPFGGPCAGSWDGVKGLSALFTIVFRGYSVCAVADLAATYFRN